MSLELNIIYEDKDFLIINKQAGLLTHPTKPEIEEFSLVDLLIKHYPPIKDVGEDLSRPGIVHRLDRDTSGLMIVSKNNEAFIYLKNLFKDREIEKRYYALVYGRLKEKSGIIESPIGKLGGKQTTRLDGKKEVSGKPAISEYKVVKEFNEYSLLDITIKTGRTHQIRIHLKSIGHPVVCDNLYKTKTQQCPEQFGRMFLHAYYLSFITPSGDPITLESDLPEDLSGGLEII